MYLVAKIDNKRNVLEYNVLYGEGLLDSLTARSWIAAGYFYTDDLASEFRLNTILTLLKYNGLYRQQNMQDVARYFRFAYSLTENFNEYDA